MKVLILNLEVKFYCETPKRLETDRLVGYVPFIADMDPFLEYLGYISKFMLDDVNWNDFININNTFIFLF